MILLYQVYIHPTNFRKLKGKKYTFRDVNCLGRTCFKPETRTLLKTKNLLIGQKLRWIDRDVHTCATMFDFGCPLTDDFSQELYDQRVSEGWLSTVL